MVPSINARAVALATGMPRGSGNLGGMDIDNDHRAAVARAWRDAKANGESQADFCVRQVPSIKPRTLRLWTQKLLATTLDPLSELRLIYAGLANMKAVADRLERHRLRGMPAGNAVASASRPLETASEPTPESKAMPERHGGIVAADAAAVDVLAADEPVVPSMPISTAPDMSAVDAKAERRARAAAFWCE